MRGRMLEGARSSTARRVARSGFLDVAWAGYRATGRLERGLREPKVQFLYLHYLDRSDGPAFRALLSSLSRTHSFLSYSEAVSRVVDNQIDRPYIAFSFDDGLASAMRGARILEEFGTTACFFVCPRIVGTDDGAAVQRFFSGPLPAYAGPTLSWSDLRALRAAGHEVGSHTLTHRRLATLAEEELRIEIQGSFDEIAEELEPPEHLAWPFGGFSDFSASAVRQAFATGYRSVASAQRGCHIARSGGPVRPEQVCIRRDHVVASWPKRHVEYFVARNGTDPTWQRSRWPDRLS